MYIRILKRHNRYVAEEIKRVLLDKNLESLCSKLRSMGIKKVMIMVDDEKAFNFNDSEKRILKESLPD